ncbi:MAG: hypothetical protein J6Y48_10915 [Clostridia bacterium]|nr:hypothetical protein [Clostridia bacterium]
METNTYMPVAPVNGGFGDGMGNGWWIILLFLFMGFGGGYGGLGGNGAGFVNADVQRGFDQSAVMGGVSNLQNGITAGFGDLQTSLCGGFAGVNAAITNGFAQAEIGENARQMANMQQMFALQTSITGTQNIVQTEGAATRAAILEQTNAILDKLCQQEIDNLKAANISLQNQLNMANLAASQTAQTQQILAALPTV